jgi:hypothetical protein
VINIDVSDVMKLLKYMHAGISRFFKPNNTWKIFSILTETQCQKRKYSAKTKYFENAKTKHILSADSW